MSRSTETSGLFCLQVKTGPVGEVFKIRLTMDKSGENPAWFVQRLKMKDEHTKQEFHFLCNFWLKADTPEEDIVVELPAIRPDSPPLKGQPQFLPCLFHITQGTVYSRDVL